MRPQGWLSGLAGLAVVALLVPPGFVAVPEVGRNAVGVAWVVPLALAAVAGASVRHLRRSDLAAGAALAGVARVSVSWFDLALLGAILAERRARALGRVRSARLRGSPVVLLVWTDVLRLRRTPNAALGWAALLPAPALVAQGGSAAAVPVVHLVAAFLATDRLAAGLKFVCRSPAMRRALGLPDRTLRLAHLVFPRPEPSCGAPSQRPSPRTSPRSTRSSRRPGRWPSSIGSPRGHRSTTVPRSSTSDCSGRRRWA